LPVGENRTYSEPIAGIGRAPNREVEANQASSWQRTEPIPNRNVAVTRGGLTYEGPRPTLKHAATLAVNAGRKLHRGQFEAIANNWFNNRRLLEPSGNIPPAEAEQAYYSQLTGSVVTA